MLFNKTKLSREMLFDKKSANEIYGQKSRSMKY